jgi:hypothetical protein
MNGDGAAAGSEVGRSTGPWLVLQGDAKNYLTLAAGLIGVTATFADRLVGGDQLGRIFLFAAWGCLGVAIGAATFASGGAFNGVAHQSSSYEKVSGRLNAAVLFIGLGVALLALAAWRTSIDQSQASGVEIARTVVVEMTDAPSEQVRVQSVVLDDLVQTYVVEWLAPGGQSQTFDLLLSWPTLELLEVTRRP